MKEKKNAVPVYQTGNGGGDQLMMEEVFSISQFTKSTEKTQVISALLMRGEANALPLQQLKRIMALDGRSIRRMIQTERENGACICVNNRDGYFLAENEAERARCAASMRHRAAEIFRTANNIERAEVFADEG